MAILAAFEEEELDRLYTDVAVGGPAFETGIVGNARAVQQRNINAYDAVRSFEIQFGGMSQAEKLRLEEFFLTKWGRAVGFRFYPPSDREFLDDVIGVGDGTTTVFYMRRNYAAPTRFVSRRIVKPVKDDVVVTLDGSKLWIDDPVFGGYIPPSAGPFPVIDSGTNFLTVDWNTGAVTFAGAPTAGQIIRCAEGRYDLPVYFDVDAFDATDYGPFADWNSIKVVEILPSQITSLGMATTPLSLAFTSPVSGEVKASAFDVNLTHSGVSKVYLFQDDVLVGSDAAAPFAFAAVPSVPGGIFRMKALGVDAAGHFVEAAVDVTSEPLPVGDDGTETGGWLG